MTTKSVKAVPEGFHTVTPSLVLNDAAAAIEYYKKAFGATEVVRMLGPGGNVMHGEIKIGDSLIMLADEFPEMSRSPRTLKGTASSVMLYVDDVDSVFKQAIDAGGTAIMPPADMFWGDRFSKLVDPFGHEWEIATHKEDVAPEEMQKRQEAFFAQMAAQK